MNIANFWTDSLGRKAVALGTNAKASGDFSFAAGAGSIAQGPSAIALGSSAYATNESSLAVGVLSNSNYLRSSAIGYDAVSTADNTITIGSNNITSIGGYVNWTNLSDGRFKKNVKEDIPGLDFINSLRPVSYNLDLEKLKSFLGSDKRRDKDDFTLKAENESRTGFIAQEVLRSAEFLGYKFSGIKKPQSDKDHFGIRYAEFVVPLVKAVQELSEENAELRKKIEQMHDIELRLQALEDKIK